LVERYGWWPAAFVGFFVLVPLALVVIGFGVELGTHVASALAGPERTYDVRPTKACMQRRGHLVTISREDGSSVMTVEPAPGKLPVAQLTFAPTVGEAKQLAQAGGSFPYARSRNVVFDGIAYSDVGWALAHACLREGAANA
jgi:hypothetical protein